MDVSAAGLAAAAAAVVAPSANGEVLASVPTAWQPSEAPTSEPPTRSGLGPAIAKLFGTKTPPAPINLDVSYRVLQHPDVIVTVFSNPQTGQEVAQFPPEILIGLAEFFDQQSGVTLDKDA